jgi:drug/metabolite transporter (DMT)-like permease
MYQPDARHLLTKTKSHLGVNMAHRNIGRKVPVDRIALGAAGLLVMFAGGWLFWYFAVRPHHPSSYSLLEIAILPLGLLVIGVLCLLAAVGEFTSTRLR